MSFHVRYTPYLLSLSLFLSLFLSLSLADTQVIIKVSGHQYQWLAGGYDLEIGHFRSG